MKPLPSPVIKSATLESLHRTQVGTADSLVWATHTRVWSHPYLGWVAHTLVWDLEFSLRSPDERQRNPGSPHAAVLIRASWAFCRWRIGGEMLRCTILLGATDPRTSTLNTVVLGQFSSREIRGDLHIGSAAGPRGQRMGARQLISRRRESALAGGATAMERIHRHRLSPRRPAKKTGASDFP